MHNPTDSAPPPTKLTSPASSCPYTPSDASSDPSASSSSLSKLNPLNYMPTFTPNTRSETQTIALPLTREPSTIPRGDGSGSKWEYPSPQQMYNAMLKKGYTDTPAQDVPAMVRVHNFLNEGAWQEIREWERRFAPGLRAGWRASRRGEGNAAVEAQRVFAAWEHQQHQQPTQTSSSTATAATSEDNATTYSEPALVRFQGRPDDLTPKAQLLGLAAWLMPSRFAADPPFDRHDWHIRRYGPGGEDLGERRYVIDYYSGQPDDEGDGGEPVFYLDVRPAVDGPVSAAERVLRWYGDFWWRAKGGDVRELKTAG